MKQKSKVMWKRILVLVLMLCVLMQTMPMAAFAEEVQDLRAEAELNEQREEVVRLEEELNTLLAAEGSRASYNYEVSTPTVDYMVTVNGEEVKYGTFQFSIRNNGVAGDYVAYLTKYTQTANAPEAYGVVIPETVLYEAGGNSYECDVVYIGQQAFQYNEAITAVTLPETVHSISKWAFQGCSALASINLPAGLTMLDGSAFQDCTALNGITLPDGLTEVGAYAFAGCTSLKLDAAEIVKDRTHIYPYAFQNTAVYGELAPPADIYLGMGAFSGTKITRLDLSADQDLAKVSELAKDCSLLTEVVFHPETTEIFGSLAENSGVTKVTIPKTVISVGGRAFKNCPVKELTFEPREDNRDLEIGQEAFYGNKLTSFTFPTMKNKDADLTLLTDCFAGSDMTTLVLDENTTACRYIQCTSPFRGQPLTNVTLPEYDWNAVHPDTVFIPKGLFQGSNITSTEFLVDSDVISLGAYAFADCDQLVEYTNGLNCANINSYAFQGCDNLTTLKNMDVVNLIGDYSFSNCDSLTQLEFWTESERKVTYDGSAVNWFTWGVGFISGSDNLETIVIHGTGTLSGTASESTSKVSWDDLQPFKGCSVDSLNFVFDGGITEAGMGSFAGAAFIKNLDFLPESVTRYAEYAFAYTGLEEVTVPAHVTFVDIAFPFCHNLASLTVENDMDAWERLYVDEDVVMDGYPLNDGMDACAYFQGTPLKSPGDDYVNVSLPSSWTTLPDGMFYGTNITDTYFLEDMPRLKSISPYAFANCDQMQEIIIPKTVERLGHRAFYNSVATVASLTIPYSVKTLEVYEGQYWPLYQQFYDEDMSGTLLEEVRIYNPELDLIEDAYLLNEEGELVDEKGEILYIKENECWNGESTDIRESFIFNYNQYDADNPLIFSGAMNSTALSLVARDGGSHLTFAPLSAAEDVTVTVQYPSGDDATWYCDITWTDESGKVIAKGSEFRPPEEDTVYYYSIQLDDYDCWKYQTPAKGKIISSTSQGEDVVITLEEIGTTDFVGKIVDENGTPVEGVNVVLKHVTDDREREAGNVETDENGQFRLENAMDMRTEVFVDYYGYYTGTAVYLGSTGAETTDLGTIALEKLPGTATQLMVQVMSADGSTRILQNMDDMIFMVGDGVSGRQIDCSIHNNLLILKGDAIDQDYPLKLKVTVKDRLNVAEPSDMIEFTLGGGAYVTLHEYGRFTLDTDNVDSVGQNVWVYKDSKLEASYTMSGGSVISDPLAAGAYTIVVMDRTAPVINPGSIEVITDLGLAEGIHFYQTNLTIADGEMTVVEGFEVPRLDETALNGLFTDMFETVSFTSSVRSPMVGQEYHLILRYKLKEEYSGSAEKVFNFSLPQETRLLDVYTPGTSDSYEPVVGSKTSSVEVRTAENEGILCLSVTSTEPAQNTCGVTLTCGSRICAQKELHYQVQPADVMIYSYSDALEDPFDYSLIVKAVPMSEVDLYLNGEWIDSAQANMVGSARFTINLPLPSYTGKEWSIYAVAHFEGQTAESETVTVTQSGDPLDPVITLNMKYRFRINHPEFNPSYFTVHQAGLGYNPDQWAVEVPEGRGSQILNGVIEIKFRDSISGTSYRIPCYRVETSDVFRGKGYAEGNFDYISLNYELTDDFWEENAKKGTGVDEESMAVHETEIEKLFAQYDASDFLDASYIQELEDSQKIETIPIDQMPEFQALTPAEQQQILQEQAEMDLKLETAQNANKQLAEALFGTDIEWEADSAEELLAQVGYSVRELEKDELKEYENDRKFLPMLFGSNMVYYYADQSETITVDVAANTVTTVKLPQVTQTSSYRGRSSGSQEAENAQILDTAINSVITTYSQMANGVDAEIAVLEETCKNYVEHIQKFGFEHPAHAAAAARLTVLKSFQKVLPVINNLLNIGTIIGMGVELWDISDKLDYWRGVYGAGGMKEECAAATLHLIEAYEDLAFMIFSQAMSALAQIGAAIGFTALAVASRLASVIGLVVSSVAGMVADLFIGYLNDQAKAKAQQAQRYRAAACDEEDEDEEIPVTPVLDPSGYVYEAVFSNRVEGVKVTTYYNDDGTAAVWDAENYDQANPLITDEYGFYQWFVPTGQWKVVAEKEGYKTADTTEIYAKLDEENERDDVINGWLTVLPEQMEVHIPMESTEAPQVEETSGYTDGISVKFSQYMKEDITVTVTQNGNTYSGNDLELVWTDREYSDHYYNEWFGSELSIRLKNGEWVRGEAAVNITKAENYVGTDLTEYSGTVTVLPAPAAIEADSLEIPFCGTGQLEVKVTDKSGEPVSGAAVEAKSAGFARLGSSAAVTDASGVATFSVEGYSVGQDTVTLTVSGTGIETVAMVTVTHDNAIYKPAEPVVYINSKYYTGQENSITAAKGTQVTIVGSDDLQYFYSIGEDSCPCEKDTQVQILNRTMTLEESGYYKFAAYDAGSQQYSERVHISVEVSGEIPKTINEVVLKIDHLPPEIGETAYPATLYSVNGMTDSEVLRLVTANHLNLWGYGWAYTNDNAPKGNPNDYTHSFYGDTQFAGKYTCLELNLEINWSAPDTEFSNDLKVVLLTGDGQRIETTRYDGVDGSTENYANYFYEVVPVEPAPRYNNTVDGDIDGGYLTVSPETPKAGQTVTVTGVPYSDYWITQAVSVTLTDGTPVNVTPAGENTFTFVQPDGAVTISAVFGLKSTETYAVTVIHPDEGAVITLVTDEPQAAGSEVTFTVTVEDGYELQYFDITDSNDGYVDWDYGDKENSYCFEMPEGGATISVSVTPITYYVYISVRGDGEWGKGGSITVLPERPRLGQGVSIMVFPDSGYTLDSLTITYWNNSISEWDELVPIKRNENLYIFAQPKDDVTIEAYFVSEALHVKQPVNGEITVNPAEPKAGDTVTITVTPDNGYETESVTVTDKDGKPVTVTKETGSTWTYTQPEGSVIISAVMAAKQYQITAAAVQNGTLTVSHGTAAAGTTVIVNAVPDEGCKLKSLSAVNENGAALTLTRKNDNTYTFTQPKSDVTVTAEFEEIQVHQHNYGTLIPAVNAVHTESELKAAAAAHYYCAECETYFTEQKEETVWDALIGEAPVHSFTIPVKDETHHWKECSCGLDEEESKAAHAGQDDDDCMTAVLCQCGHELTAAQEAHDFSGQWQKDKNGHWHVCQNAGCEAEGTAAPHENGTDKVCDICGYDSYVPPQNPPYNPPYTPPYNPPADDPAEPELPVIDEGEALREAVDSIQLTARSEMSKAKGKKAVKLSWFDQNGADLSFLDGYDIFRSIKRYNGYGKKPFFTTERTQYWNTAVESGKKYYYKVRGFVIIDDKKYYTDWSLKAWRTVK